MVQKCGMTTNGLLGAWRLNIDQTAQLCSFRLKHVLGNWEIHTEVNDEHK